MNNTFIKTLTLTATLFATSTAYAEAARSTAEVQQAGVFGVSAVVGAVVAGPLGFAIGALGGAWVGNELGDKEQLGIDLANSQSDLDQLRMQFANLQRDLNSSQDQSERLAEIALEQLQLELMFKTGNSELSKASQQRIGLIAKFLELNPSIIVRLDGFADPRGDENYNRQLSDNRVQSVVKALLSHQVPKDRISQYSHGASVSSALPGDYDAYAMERIVRISLSNRSTESVAQVSLN